VKGGSDDYYAVIMPGRNGLGHLSYDPEYAIVTACRADGDFEDLTIRGND
jgi:hypothetical protein